MASRAKVLFSAGSPRGRAGSGPPRLRFNDEEATAGFGGSPQRRGRERQRNAVRRSRDLSRVAVSLPASVHTPGGKGRCRFRRIGAATSGHRCFVPRSSTRLMLRERGLRARDGAAAAGHTHLRESTFDASAATPAGLLPTGVVISPHRPRPRLSPRAEAADASTSPTRAPTSTRRSP